ncbi:outer mitochondrial transmembrane helix translocase [Halyomorpha halys]|uniref:outer mitochondrial transmembrane helix translocase n=1 Tax=Halyomorpha halys TaxID=286706 RepID=UPI0006D4DB25|nr:ATPase family AAA domain-containing protein 1-A [Halyomorpha halys]
MPEGITRADIFFTLLRVSLFSVTALLTAKLLMKHLDPTNKRKTYAAKTATDLLDRLGIKIAKQLTEYELMIANHLVDPQSIAVSWDSIGGLGHVIQEIQETVILPIRRRELFSNSQLTQPPKGVLLHGPPGCGKTMIAKATAKEAGTNFINLDLSILTDKWYGESQKLASAVFSLAVKLQPCIIFIDEIDSFLRSRNVQDHEATAMMKAQFMTLWDGLNTDPGTTVIVMGATNRPHDLDKAILRRMPAIFHIPLPTLVQRKDILNLVMSGEPLADNVDLSAIAAHTEGFSGSDLKELCRNASLYRVRDYVANTQFSEKLKERSVNSSTMKLSEDQEEFHDTLRPITMDDLTKSLKKMRDAKVNTSSLTLD